MAAPGAKPSEEKKEENSENKPALPGLQTCAAHARKTSLTTLAAAPAPAPAPLRVHILTMCCCLPVCVNPAEFGGFGSGAGFSSNGTTPFTFASVLPGKTSFGAGNGFGFGAGAAPAGGFTASPYTFGNSGKPVGFGDVSSAGWAPKKKDDAEADGEAGDDDDAEKEVQVKKSDAVVQLEEVETCTGEEDETTAFQVRAKLFVLGSADSKDADEEKSSPQKSESKESDAKDDVKEGDKKDNQWVVIGIGNLKINVPKSDCTGLCVYICIYIYICICIHIYQYICIYIYKFWMRIIVRTVQDSLNGRRRAQDEKLRARVKILCGAIGCWCVLMVPQVIGSTLAW